MKRNVITLIFLISISLGAQAQFGKLKNLVGGKKDTTQTKTDDKKEKGQGGSGGGKLFTKLVTKVAKASGSMLTTTTPDLSTVVMNAYYQTNLHPNNLGTLEQSFFNGWQGGGNLLGIMFTGKETFSLNKLEGEVKINGVPAEYITTGIYSGFSADNKSPKKVEVVMNNGQKSSFTVNPPKQSVNVVSINGQKDNVSLDLTKDVVLELENLPAGDQTPILVSLAINSLGIKAYYNVGYFSPADKIVIPAGYFRNINIAPGNTKSLGFNYKGSFLKVERSVMEEATDVSGFFTKVEYASIYSDGKFVTVTNEPQINVGLTAKGKEAFPNGAVNYELYKPNAFMSRSSAQIKAIGVTSFSIRGTTFYASETSNEWLGTTTYKEATFPQMADEVWESMLDKLYTGLIPIIESEFKISVLPLEKITSTQAYQSMMPYSKDDSNTKVEFSRAYKTTKVISAFLPISESYGLNTADGRLMKESGANALLKVTLDVRLTFDGPKPTMVPVMGVELLGEQNGPTTSTKYFTATITGDGVPYSKNITPQILEEIIIRKSDLLATFKKGLQELHQQEVANPDYNMIWNEKR